MAEIRIFGLDKVLRNLRKANDEILNKVSEAVEKTVVDAVNFAKAGHEQDAHGKERFISRSGTAGLIGSIEGKLLSVTKNEAVGIIFASKEYAPYVEIGTTRSAAFPFLLPAAHKAGPILKRRLTDLV